MRRSMVSTDAPATGRRHAGAAPVVISEEPVFGSDAAVVVETAVGLGPTLPIQVISVPGVVVHETIDEVVEERVREQDVVEMISDAAGTSQHEECVIQTQVAGGGFPEDDVVERHGDAIGSP